MPFDGEIGPLKGQLRPKRKKRNGNDEVDHKEIRRDDQRSQHREEKKKSRDGSSRGEMTRKEAPRSLIWTAEGGKNEKKKALHCLKKKQRRGMSLVRRERDDQGDPRPGQHRETLARMVTPERLPTRGTGEFSKRLGAPRGGKNPPVGGRAAERGPMVTGRRRTEPFGKDLATLPY